MAGIVDFWQERLLTYILDFGIHDLSYLWRVNILNTQKVAITIPKNLVKIIDDISKMNGVSRSKFISTVLYERVLDEKKKNVKKVYDKIFSDSAICKEQLETALWFGTADANEGQEW